MSHAVFTTFVFQRTKVAIDVARWSNEDSDASEVVAPVTSIAASAAAGAAGERVTTVWHDCVLVRCVSILNDRLFIFNYLFIC